MNMFMSSTLLNIVFSVVIINLHFLSIVEASLPVQDTSQPNTGASGLTHCQGDCYDDTECALASFVFKELRLAKASHQDVMGQVEM